jgi:MFS family permease
MKLFTLDPAALRGSPAVRVWLAPSYRRLMSGLVVFYVTGWMQRVGVGWLAWELSHSHAWVGAIAAADLLPLVVLGPLAGAAADRADPLRQLRWAQIAMSAQAVALMTATLGGIMTIELLFALSLASGLIQPSYTASRQTLVPATVPRADYPSAVTLDSTLYHASRFLGPMLAAALIALLGVEATFAAHVVGCLFVYVQVARLDVEIPSRAKIEDEGLARSIMEGIRYVRRHEGLWPMFLMLAVASLFARPLQELLPGFAGGVFDAGASGLAWLTSSFGVGSLCAGLVMATRGHVRGLASASIAATCTLAVTTFGFVATSRLGLAIAFGVVWGFSLTLMGVGIQAQAQVAVADSMRGRVMMIYAIIYRGLPAIGALGIGVAAEHMGLRSTFALAALLTLIAWLAVAPRHKAIDAAMSRRRDL